MVQLEKIIYLSVLVVIVMEILFLLLNIFLWLFWRLLS